MELPFCYSKVNLEEKIFVLIDEEGIFGYKLGRDNTNPIVYSCEMTKHFEDEKCTGIFLVSLLFVEPKHYILDVVDV